MQSSMMRASVVGNSEIVNSPLQQHTYIGYGLHSTRRDNFSMQYHQYHSVVASFSTDEKKWIFKDHKAPVALFDAT